MHNGVLFHEIDYKLTNFFFILGSYMVNWSPNLQTAVSDLVSSFRKPLGFALAAFLLEIILF